MVRKAVKQAPFKLPVSAQQKGQQPAPAAKPAKSKAKAGK
jgi:hypothetical protein